MSKLGIVGAWVALSVGVAAFGCGSGGGGTGAMTGSGSGTGTTTGTTTSTGSAGTSSSSTGGGTCPIKSAACQMCIQQDCSPGGSPPMGLQTWVDCMCAAQLANDTQAANKCTENYDLQPGGAGATSCIANSCASQCS